MSNSFKKEIREAPKARKTSKLVAVRLPVSLIEKLDRFTKATGATKTEVIELALCKAIGLEDG